MNLKSICETCEQCKFLARGVQASLSVRRMQANSTSTSSMRKASEAASASSSAQATFDKAESKMQEESSPVMINGEPLTLERAKRVLITMGRERTEFEKRIAEQQEMIFNQEQTIENQTLKMQRMRKEFDTSKLDAAEKQNKKIDESDLSGAVISDSQKKENVVPDLKEQSYNQSLSSSSINNAHERRISLVPILTPAQKATKSPSRKLQRVSFGTKREEGSFYKDTEPNTPIISTRVSIPGKNSIKQLNLQRVVEAVRAAKKAGITINPERPLVRIRSFFPPSPASAEIHMLMPPGPAGADEIPVPPQRKESSPPPPPAGTPPATPRELVTVQQQLDVIPPPPDSTPPSSLIAPDSPSTIRRDTRAKSLHLSMFTAGVDLPPDPDKGV